MSATVHYLPTANGPVFPRKGPGRLPAGVASMRRARARRTESAEPELVDALLEAARTAFRMLQERQAALNRLGRDQLKEDVPEAEKGQSRDKAGERMGASDGPQ